MSRFNKRDITDLLIAKRACYVVRITGFVKGNNKNKFINDCLKRGNGESQQLQSIIDVYYSIIDTRPDLAEKEMHELKKIINDRIKL